MILSSAGLCLSDQFPGGSIPYTYLDLVRRMLLHAVNLDLSQGRMTCHPVYISRCYRTSLFLASSALELFVLCQCFRCFAAFVALITGSFLFLQSGQSVVVSLRSSRRCQTNAEGIRKILTRPIHELSMTMATSCGVTERTGSE